MIDLLARKPGLTSLVYVVTLFSAVGVIVAAGALFAIGVPGLLVAIGALAGVIVLLGAFVTLDDRIGSRMREMREQSLSAKYGHVIRILQSDVFTIDGIAHAGVLVAATNTLLVGGRELGV